ncbi:hypothetical protein F0562_030964 [Nyssa sinensis]|uniref:Fungal lipase-type domain-containing protein n=1 Tax=Nyssa sinensis TaxID=561372 RepID=A0A5J5AV26_9ASTE|nr:hypothetical protein F0562_030964 [Nyssa sinensis]
MDHRRSVAASLVQGVYILERDRQQKRQGPQALAPPWLQQSSRFQIAMQAVQNMVAVAGAANIWLAGHSLGSAIALLTGKNMVKMRCPVETYLFNPPFSSAPIETIKNQKVKHGVHLASSVIKAGIAVAVKGHHQTSQDNSFTMLSAWVPYLFVNASDPICSEYIGYFEHREKMVNMGGGGIGRLAAQNSMESLLSAVLGKDSEPSHLLPSAYLTVNPSPSQNFKQAHGIHQWLRPNFYLQSKLHQFR